MRCANSPTAAIGGRGLALTRAHRALAGGGESLEGARAGVSKTLMFQCFGKAQAYPEVCRAFSEVGTDARPEAGGAARLRIRRMLRGLLERKGLVQVAGKNRSS